MEDDSRVFFPRRVFSLVISHFFNLETDVKYIMTDKGIYCLNIKKWKQEWN